MKGNGKQSYTAEFKAEVVQLVKDGKTYTAVAEAKKVAPQSVRNWVLRSKNGNGLARRKSTGPRHRKTPQEKADNLLTVLGHEEARLSAKLAHVKGLIAFYNEK